MIHDIGLLFCATLYLAAASFVSPLWDGWTKRRSLRSDHLVHGRQCLAPNS